ncbi:MAG: hypothetical protein PHT59_06145 [Candidatus Omnitrophica bacterium]|nr:hypothetical protein [Candidatus Omnitrophota bacterium]
MKAWKTVVTAGFILLAATAAYADDCFWLGDVDNSWSEELNWMLARPEPGDNALIDNGDMVIFNYNYVVGNPLGQLTLADDGSLLEMDSGSYNLAASGETIGSNGYAGFIQYAGTNTVTGDLYQGYYAGSLGDYFLNELNPLSPATLSVGGNHLIGWGGNGYFELDAGTHHVSGDLNLGQGTSTTGNYYLYGGDLQTGGSLNIGHDGQGYFMLDAFDSTTHVGYHIVLGNEPTGNGTLELYDGTVLSDGEEIIGRRGSGWFSQYGGINSMGDNFILGSEEDSYGEYYLGGGTLEVNRTIPDYKEVFIGREGEGYFYQDGGFFDAHDSAVYLGAAATGVGTYEMRGGQFDADGMAVGEWGGTGNFYQHGGTVNMVNYPLWLARQDNSSGTYTMYDGFLNVLDEDGDFNGDIVVGNRGDGVFNQYGGTVTAVQNVVISGTPVGNVSTGVYNLSGGTLNAHTINNNDRFNYSGGTLNACIANSAGATVELSGTGTRTINGIVHNYGTFRVTNTNAAVGGEFRNFNALISDAGSQSYFQDLIIEPDGFLQAGWVSVARDFRSQSTRAIDYQTFNGRLNFTAGAHTVIFNGADVGPDEVLGYQNNFNWGDVNFGGGTFTLLPQDNGTWGALYTGTIQPDSFDFDVSGNNITNIVSGDSNIYYLGQYNEWLGWKTYNFADGDTIGQLRPVGVVPEPVSCALFLLGAGALAGARKLRRK